MVNFRAGWDAKFIDSKMPVLRRDVTRIFLPLLTMIFHSCDGYQLLQLSHNISELVSTIIGIEKSVLFNVEYFQFLNFPNI